MHRGLAFGITSYLIWGLSPLFWKMLSDVDAVDNLAVRIVATFGLLAALLSVRGEWAGVRARLSDGVGKIACLTALLLCANWATYVWAVVNDRVTEASLGYFLNPLVSVLLGTVVLGERLRPRQGVAVALAAVGVLWLAIAAGSPPWVSLVLAFSFGFYGLVRKMASLAPIEGLTLESGLLVVPALLLIIWRLADGGSSIAAPSLSTVGLLAATGVVTATPLLLFAAATRTVSLSTLGIAQYLAPSLQLFIGVVLYDEAMGRDRTIGFAIIWTAVLTFAWDGWRSSRTTVDAGVSPSVDRDQVGASGSGSSALKPITGTGLRRPTA